jgi:hypothetical protein
MRQLYPSFHLFQATDVGERGAIVPARGLESGTAIVNDIFTVLGIRVARG